MERGVGGEERTQNKTDITHNTQQKLCCHGNHTHYSSEVLHIIGCAGGEPHEANVVAIVEFCDYINGGEQPVRGRGEEGRREQNGYIISHKSVSVAGGVW